MKQRTGFVSNSSSSSFIIIDWSGKFVDLDKYNKDFYSLKVGACLGETNFGWGPNKLTDMGDRINFAYIQAFYSKKDKGNYYLDMLDKVIKEFTGATEIYFGDLEDDTNHGSAYIDHQSSCVEGANMEMFDSELALKHFLFGKNSQIGLDNDNE